MPLNDKEYSITAYGMTKEREYVPLNRWELTTSKTSSYQEDKTMSYIPDAREKYSDSRFDSTVRPNAYYEELIKGKGKAFLDGYDRAVDRIGETFLNIGDTENKYEYLKAGLDIKDIDEETLADFLESDKGYEYYEHASKATKLIMMLLDEIYEYLEDDRNMLVVSMIDSMDEKKHEKRMKKIFGDEYERQQ